MNLCDFSVGDLVQNKSGHYGIVEWVNNTWWHRKKKIHNVLVVYSDSGIQSWEDHQRLNIINKA